MSNENIQADTPSAVSLFAKRLPDARYPEAMTEWELGVNYENMDLWFKDGAKQMHNISELFHTDPRVTAAMTDVTGKKWTDFKAMTTHWQQAILDNLASIKKLLKGFYGGTILDADIVVGTDPVQLNNGERGIIQSTFAGFKPSLQLLNLHGDLTKDWFKVPSKYQGGIEITKDYVKITANTQYVPVDQNLDVPVPADGSAWVVYDLIECSIVNGNIGILFMENADDAGSNRTDVVIHSDTPTGLHITKIRPGTMQGNILRVRLGGGADQNSGRLIIKPKALFTTEEAANAYVAAGAQDIKFGFNMIKPRIKESVVGLNHANMSRREVYHSAIVSAYDETTHELTVRSKSPLAWGHVAIIVPMKAGATVTASIGQLNSNIGIKDKAGSTIASDLYSGKKSVTFTVPDDGLVRINFYATLGTSEITTKLFTKFQLVYGSETKDFEPYEGEFLILDNDVDFPNGFMGTADHSDEITTDSYIKRFRNLERLLPDTFSGFGVSSAPNQVNTICVGGRIKGVDHLELSSGGTQNIICSHLPSKTPVEVWNNDAEGISVNPDGYIHLRIKKILAPDLFSATLWLQQHNVLFSRLMDEPQTIPYTGKKLIAPKNATYSVQFGGQKPSTIKVNAGYMGVADMELEVSRNTEGREKIRRDFDAHVVDYKELRSDVDHLEDSVYGHPVFDSDIPMKNFHKSSNKRDGVVLNSYKGKSFVNVLDMGDNNCNIESTGGNASFLKDNVIELVHGRTITVPVINDLVAPNEAFSIFIEVLLVENSTSSENLIIGQTSTSLNKDNVLTYVEPGNIYRIDFAGAATLGNTVNLKIRHDGANLNLKVRIRILGCALNRNGSCPEISSIMKPRLNVVKPVWKERTTQDNLVDMRNYVMTRGSSDTKIAQSSSDSMLLSTSTSGVNQWSSIVLIYKLPPGEVVTFHREWEHISGDTDGGNGKVELWTCDIGPDARSSARITNLGTLSSMNELVVTVPENGYIWLQLFTVAQSGTILSKSCEILFKNMGFLIGENTEFTPFNGDEELVDYRYIYPNGMASIPGLVSDTDKVKSISDMVTIDGDSDLSFGMTPSSASNVLCRAKIPNTNTHDDMEDKTLLVSERFIARSYDDLKAKDEPGISIGDGSVWFKVPRIHASDLPILRRYLTENPFNIRHLLAVPIKIKLNRPKLYAPENCYFFIESDGEIPEVGFNLITDSLAKDEDKLGDIEKQTTSNTTKLQEIKTDVTNVNSSKLITVDNFPAEVGDIDTDNVLTSIASEMKFHGQSMVNLYDKTKVELSGGIIVDQQGFFFDGGAGLGAGTMVLEVPEMDENSDYIFITRVYQNTSTEPLHSDSNPSYPLASDKNELVAPGKTGVMVQRHRVGGLFTVPYRNKLKFKISDNGGSMKFDILAILKYSGPYPDGMGSIGDIVDDDYMKRLTDEYAIRHTFPYTLYTAAQHQTKTVVFSLTEDAMDRLLGGVKIDANGSRLSIICSHFKSSSFNHLNETDEECIALGTSGTLYVRILRKKLSEATIEAFKYFLQHNTTGPITFRTILKTPIKLDRPNKRISVPKNATYRHRMVQHTGSIMPNILVSVVDRDGNKLLPKSVDATKHATYLGNSVNGLLDTVYTGKSVTNLIDALTKNDISNKNDIIATTADGSDQFTTINVSVDEGMTYTLVVKVYRNNVSGDVTGIKGPMNDDIPLSSAEKRGITQYLTFTADKDSDTVQFGPSASCSSGVIVYEICGLLIGPAPEGDFGYPMRKGIVSAVDTLSEVVYGENLSPVQLPITVDFDSSSTESYIGQMVVESGRQITLSARDDEDHIYDGVKVLFSPVKLDNTYNTEYKIKSKILSYIGPGIDFELSTADNNRFTIPDGFRYAYICVDDSDGEEVLSSLVIKYGDAVVNDSNYVSYSRVANQYCQYVKRAMKTGVNCVDSVVSITETEQLFDEGSWIVRDPEDDSILMFNGFIARQSGVVTGNPLILCENMIRDVEYVLTGEFKQTKYPNRLCARYANGTIESLATMNDNFEESVVKFKSPDNKDIVTLYVYTGDPTSNSYAKNVSLTRVNPVGNQQFGKNDIKFMGRAIPGGVKDEFDVLTGKYIQRVGSKILTRGDINPYTQTDWNSIYVEYADLENCVPFDDVTQSRFLIGDGSYEVPNYHESYDFTVHTFFTSAMSNRLYITVNGGWSDDKKYEYFEGMEILYELDRPIIHDVPHRQPVMVRHGMMYTESPVFPTVKYRYSRNIASQVEANAYAVDRVSKMSNEVSELVDSLSIPKYTDPISTVDHALSYGEISKGLIRTRHIGRNVQNYVDMGGMSNTHVILGGTGSKRDKDGIYLPHGADVNTWWAVIEKQHAKVKQGEKYTVLVELISNTTANQAGILKCANGAGDVIFDPEGTIPVMQQPGIYSLDVVARDTSSSAYRKALVFYTTGSGLDTNKGILFRVLGIVPRGTKGVVNQLSFGMNAASSVFHELSYGRNFMDLRKTAVPVNYQFVSCDTNLITGDVTVQTGKSENWKRAECVVTNLVPGSKVSVCCDEMHPDTHIDVKDLNGKLLAVIQPSEKSEELIVPYNGVIVVLFFVTEDTAAARTVVFKNVRVVADPKVKYSRYEFDRRKINYKDFPDGMSRIGDVYDTNSVKRISNDFEVKSDTSIEIHTAGDVNGARIYLGTSASYLESSIVGPKVISDVGVNITSDNWTTIDNIDNFYLGSTGLQKIMIVIPKSVDTVDKAREYLLGRKYRYILRSPIKIDDPQKPLEVYSGGNYYSMVDLEEPHTLPLLPEKEYILPLNGAATRHDAIDGLRSLSRNLADLNTDLDIKLTPQWILDQLKTVDGKDSGLDADRLRGMRQSSLSEPDTVVARDSSGAFTTALINVINEIRVGASGNPTDPSVTCLNDEDTGLNFFGDNRVEIVAGGESVARATTTELQVKKKLKVEHDEGMTIKNWNIKERSDGGLGFYK